MPAIAPPVNLAGVGMRVRRQSGTQAVPYDLLAAAKTKSLTYTNEFGETTTHDANDLAAIPWRTSLPISRAWTLAIKGGGMAEVEASALLSRYRDQPLVPYVGLACDILGAALAGIPTTKAPPGKPGAGRQGRRRATSPRSTPPAEPSGSPPSKSGP